MNTVFIIVLALDICLYLLKKKQQDEDNYILTNSRLSFPFQKLLILII